MVENKEIDFDEMRKSLSSNQPVRFVNKTIGDGLIATHLVVMQLLNVIEAQEKRIKALEDQADHK